MYSQLGAAFVDGNMDWMFIIFLDFGMLRSRTYIEGYSEEELTKRNTTLIYASIGLHSGPPSLLRSYEP